jgi:inosine-uridine nucleoside N-ribohydrolase
MPQAPKHVALPLLPLLSLLALLCSHPPTHAAPSTNQPTTKRTTTPTSQPTSRPTKRTIPVWIDADPAVGLFGKDVDDGFAMLQAFRSNELAIRGVSIVFGNAPLNKAFPIAKTMFSLLPTKGIPLVAGAASHKDLGKPTDASRALAKALRKEKLTLLVLGPATNIATVLLRHPALASQIVKIVSVAGRRPGQKFLTGKANTPHRDYNFECDPKAYNVLLKSNIPLVFAPWEISSKVWLRSPDLIKLGRAHAFGKWLASPAKWWLFFWKSLFGTTGFNPFDTLAVGYLTSPHLLICDKLPMKITYAPNDTPNKAFLGKLTQTKPYLTVNKHYKKARIVTYCHTPRPTFRRDLITRLLRPTSLSHTK